MKNLNKLRVGELASIQLIKTDKDENLAIRLAHLGFLENESITVLKKTPFTGDALLISIRGAQIALTKREANIILVQICQKN